MRSFPFFQQSDSKDCGPTCLKMVAKFYGWNLSPESLRKHAQIGEEGVNLVGLSEAARYAGFRSQAVSLTYGALKSDAPLPAILH